MSTYDNTNRGAMWKNDRKQSDTHPDLSGSINIEGTEYWLSGWTKKQGDSDNKPLVSVSIRKKEAAPAPKPAQSEPMDIDADIPW